MIVQCDACNAKFKLDDSKIKPTGVKVRCTKCQNVFLVTPPPEETVPKQEETVEVSFGGQPEPSHKAPEMDFGSFSEQPAPPKQEEKKQEPLKWDVDFTFEEKPIPDINIRGQEQEEKKSEWDIGIPSAPAKEEAPFSFAEKTEAPQPEVEKTGFGFEVGEEPALGAEKKQAAPSVESSGFSFEGGFEPAAEKTSFEIEPPPTEEEFVVSSREEAKTVIMGAPQKQEAKTVIMGTPPIPKAPAEDFSVTGFEETKEPLFEAPSEKRKLSARIIFPVIIVLLLAIGAGAVYLNMGTGFLTKAAAPQKTMDIIGMKGYYINNASLGQLFVIEGKVVNNFDAPKEIAGIHGVVFDKTGKPLKDVWVAPGRIVAQDELKSIAAADLEKRFKDKKGAIPSNGTVPFMIIFQGVSGELAEFSVEIGQ